LNFFLLAFESGRATSESGGHVPPCPKVEVPPVNSVQSLLIMLHI